MNGSAISRSRSERWRAFELSGMFYTSYLWNFNEPDNRQNTLRSLDNQDNTFGVDLFQLGIGKKGPGGISAFIKLDVGNTASRIGADWTGNGQFTGVTGDSGDFEIEEVYANYAPDWSHGLSAKFGKFVTLLGAEVIEAPFQHELQPIVPVRLRDPLHEHRPHVQLPHHGCPAGQPGGGQRLGQRRRQQQRQDVHGQRRLDGEPAFLADRQRHLRAEENNTSSSTRVESSTWYPRSPSIR